MHLITILAFAVMFLRADQDAGWRLVDEGQTALTLLIVWGQPPLIGLMGWMLASAARTRLEGPRYFLEDVQAFHHRGNLVLRGLVLLGFAVSVLLTPWASWFSPARIHPALQIFGDLMVLSAFLASILALWVADYSLDRQLHARVDAEEGAKVSASSWTLWRYLDFHLRLQVLAVAVPLTLIMFLANLTRAYGRQIQEALGWAWAPEGLLGVGAFAVFLIAPRMLIQIWRTTPLPPGPLRDKLDAMCGRMGLRCRDILVWNTDGMMINAAVMGLIGPLRYVLLSDALLRTLTDEQIEAVFGHEAGHVRHHHIPLFLLFAMIGWLLVSALLELVSRSAGATQLPAGLLESVGIGATVLFWGVGFGWVSRRFERQADLHGARSITASLPACTLPCSVHMDRGSLADADGRVCATAAGVFSSALERVAVLNGIPREERSWRHSSIGSRIRFLRRLAGDPSETAQFDRMLRRLKACMVVFGTTGLLGWFFYGWAYRPALLGF